MTKRKKIFLTITGIIISLLVIVGVAFGVKLYLDNRIKFEINDTLPDGNGKKARVILLAGQSNASGCSSDEYLKKKVSENKYAEYSNGYSNVYINYFASDNNRSSGFVKTTVCQGEIGGYFGPELGIAEKLSEQYPNELFFVIKYAWGATDLFNLWLSPSSDGEIGQLYNAFVKYVETSLEYLHDKNYDIQIEGMCWMQGESDSFTVENATNYEEHLSNFIKDIRNEFSDYSSVDGIAFIDAYIADNPMYWVYCDMVNESKKAVSEYSELNVVIDTNAEGLTCSEEPEETPDMAHYDSLSQIKLGHLFAERLIQFF